MKHDLTTGTWQDDTGCPISIVLAATSDDLSASHRTSNMATTSQEKELKTYCGSSKTQKRTIRIFGRT